MNKVRGRAINANTQNTNNFSMWMEPLSHKQYPVTDVINPTNKALITSDGTRNTIVAKPGITYNDVSLDVSGALNPSRWLTGQTINTVFLAGNDALLAQTANVITTGGTIASYLYTPRSNNSKIIVEYSAVYDIAGNSGGGTDTFESRITVTGVTDAIAYRKQVFPSGDGVANRSSTLFPIMGAYNNSALTNIRFNITISNPTDTVDFDNQASSACMKITEISL
jgi:hypothetical protein